MDDRKRKENIKKDSELHSTMWVSSMTLEYVNYIPWATNQS